MKLRNNIAAFGWVLSLFFLVVCLAGTYVEIRDGWAAVQIYPPDIPDYYPSWFRPLLLAVFWLSGFGAMNHCSKIPCVLVEVLSDKSVMIERRYLFRKVQMILPNNQLTSAAVESTGDSMDPYYEVQFRDAGGVVVIIAESFDRAHCQDICSRFNIAIGRQCQS